MSQGTVARSSTDDARRQREAQVRAKKELQIRQARRSAAAFIEYAIRNEEDDSVLKNAPFHEEWQEHLEEHRLAVLICSVEFGKMIALDTPIPTPGGFKPMADVRVGDMVFGLNGLPTRVRGLSPIEPNPDAYWVRFEDGGALLVDAEHRWGAWTQYDRDRKFPIREVTTAQMMAAGLRTKYGSWNWKIPRCAPVQYPERDLPVHPYVLGAWLGNGSRNSGSLTCHSEDESILLRCAELSGSALGVGPRLQGGALRATVEGLVTDLKRLGVETNKHVPGLYMTASEQQRRELLAGLLDTDGNVSNNGKSSRNRVEFGSADKPLAEAVLELARSLGDRASMVEGRARLNGVDHGPFWRVTWNPLQNPFWSKRKREQFCSPPKSRVRNDSRTIVAIEKATPVPMRCLTVEASDGLFLAGRDYTVTHNSQQVAVGKVLHLLGNNPEFRGAIISSTALQAEKLLRQIRTEIESNPRIAEVFPHLKRSTMPADPWHSNQITVRRKTRSKDPSLQVMGTFGPLVGSRLDFIVLDDVLDFENTRTEEQRKKLIEWVDTTVLTRLTPRGRFIVVGTPWHPDDLLHDLEKRPGFVTKRYAAVLNPDDNPKRWVSMWPERWPLDRLLDRKAITADGVFVRKYLCRVRIDSTSRFKQVWLDRMCALGKGRTFLPQAPRAHVRGQKLPCFTGVDLGIGGGPENGRTVLFTIALMPDTRRLIVEIESGHWQAPEIIDRLASVYQRFDSEILVESNGAQQFLIDMCQGRIPVRGQATTAGNKFHETFGVESLAVEMRNGLWVMPSGSDGTKVHDEGRRFMNECLYYDPELHCGDLLMAAWLSREALRKYAQPWVRNQNSQAR